MKKQTDKSEQRVHELIQRTAEVFECSENEARELLMQPLQQSVRVNTLQSDLAGEAGLEPLITRLEPVALPLGQSQISANLAPIPWAAACYTYSGSREALTRSEAFESGAIYLQNKASFIPPILLDPQEGDRIADLCAAPGGKSSHIAAITGNMASLWVNDNSRGRLAKMRANFDRLHVQPAMVTLMNVEQLSRPGSPYEEASFDKILLDAPCSGEGLIDITSKKDMRYWSTAQIKRLATLQKRALKVAWKLLRPGGTLIYSTCTIAPEENEAVISYFMRHNDNAMLAPIELDLPERWPALKEWRGKSFHQDIAHTLRIKPANGTEAFYVAKILKTNQELY